MIVELKLVKNVTGGTITIKYLTWKEAQEKYEALKEILKRRK